MINYTKQNPIKVATGAIAIVSSMVSGVLFAEERYNQQPDVQIIQKDLRAIRTKDLEDKIFILNFKKSNGTISPLDEALLHRYESELKK